MIGQQPILQDVLRQLTTKRRVFVSYHHANDQWYYDRFNGLFSGTYDILYDNSVQRKYDSENTDYVDRCIREEHIKGTSITIVLCGAETWKRKYVDWEIYATLHHQHALLGVKLPTALVTPDFKAVVPGRFHTNLQKGYAHWIDWTEDAGILKTAIEVAITRSRSKHLIDNNALKLSRNRP